MKQISNFIDSSACCPPCAQPQRMPEKQGVKSVFIIQENRRIASNMFLMSLEGDTSAIAAPGQFVNIALEGFYLRRPMSICDWSEKGLTVAYRIVGRGTEYMRGLAPGAGLELLVGLGNGFDTAKSGASPLLIGGGSGTAPLLGLARALIAEGKKVKAVTGFAGAGEVFLAEELSAAGVGLTVATADGSEGVKGLVTDALEGMDYSYVYACGPEPMLKAVSEMIGTSGQFSFEARMGCGFGACMGCSCETKYGARRICRDGPVLEKEEIIW